MPDLGHRPRAGVRREAYLKVSQLVMEDCGQRIGARCRAGVVGNEGGVISSLVHKRFRRLKKTLRIPIKVRLR